MYMRKFPSGDKCNKSAEIKSKIKLNYEEEKLVGLLNVQVMKHVETTTPQ